jgi:hypothetical protein
MKYRNFFALLLAGVMFFVSPALSDAWTIASNNIPLDSPVYGWLEKLESFGLIKSNMNGIRPFTRAEAARLLLEAEGNLAENPQRPDAILAASVLAETRAAVAREAGLRNVPNSAPGFDYLLVSSYRARSAFVDGVPRSYERGVHDPGNDGVFGIGHGLRPKNPYPSVTQQHGAEGTPLIENNEGVVYRRGYNVDVRFTSEVFVGSWASALVEPMLLKSWQGEGSLAARLNKGYVKIGSDAVELEVGRDANWLGLGYRGAISLTNNARNFDIVKLSSPEPVRVPWGGPFKYSLILSRFDESMTAAGSRRPYFLASKLSLKPADFVEVGLNVSRQFGGPGVDNSFGSMVRGVIGGTNRDNANNLAGLELRFRIPWLRNTQVYGEFSGEDAASFWPIVESYVAGLYIPRLTSSGKDDLRFEYFLGNAILYTSGTFSEGYIYHGMPIGHSQGGAAQELYFRYSHWFSARNNLALEYWHGERGNLGRIPVNGVMQAVERKDSMRGTWKLPLYGDIDCALTYGWERVRNRNLAGGQDRTNQIAVAEISYRYR